MPSEEAAAEAPTGESAAAARFEPSWDGPSCFAFAEQSGGYACLEFSLSADASGASGVSVMDPATFEPPASVAWRGHKAVQLVGRAPETLMLAEKPYDVATPMTEAMDAIQVQNHLADKGYAMDAPIRAVELGAEWTELGGGSLRFRSRQHIGDVSEYHLASLEFVCPGEMVSSAQEILTEGRGESAKAFYVPDAERMVVSVIQRGGGEGSWYFRVLNLEVAFAERCGVTSPVSG